MDGSLNFYQRDYIAGKQALFATAVAKNTAALDRLRYPFAADPAAVAGTP